MPDASLSLSYAASAAAPAAAPAAKPARARRRVLPVVAVAALSGSGTLLPVTEAAFSAVTQRPASSAATKSAFACEAYAAEVRQTSTVSSFWRLGESGTTANDSVGSRPGSYVGGLSKQVEPHSTSEADRAVAFTAAGQYVGVGDFYDFAGIAAFTIEAWVRPRAGATPDGQRVVSKDGSPGGVPSGWALTYRASGAISFSRWRSATTTTSTISPVLTGDRWYHVTGVYTGSEQRLYLDGTLVASSPDAVSLPDTTLPLRLGAAAEGSSPPAFPGALDDVAVYTSALSASRVARHAQANCTYASLTRRTPGLASSWSLDELAPDATDGVGGRTAVEAGPTSPGARGALPSNSRFARGFTGDGSLSAGDVYDFAAGSSFSLELWLRPEAGAFSRYGRALAKETGTSGTRSGWLLLVHPNGLLGYEQWNAGNNVAGLGAPALLSADKWYHVVVTYDGVALRLYVDGAQVATATPSAALPDTTAALRLGGTDYENGGSRWVGGLDEVAVYTSALTPAQVSAHYDAR